MRIAVGAAIALGLVAGLLLLSAARGPAYYQPPPAPTLILWDSRVDAQASVPRPDHPAVAGFLRRLPGTLAHADLEQAVPIDLSSYGIVMVHPSALDRMDPALVQDLKAHLFRGVVVWMSAEIGPFLRKLDLDGFGYVPSGSSSATVVGLGITDVGGLLPGYMLISVPADALARDGPRVALHGLISGASQLLAERAAR